jgi:hypothetical protein
MQNVLLISRRIILIIVALFVFGNALIFSLLNSPWVHGWMRDKANEHFAKANLEISLGPVSLDLFAAELFLSDIKIAERNGEKRELVSAKRLVIGFQPLRFNQRWIPSFKFLALEDWDANIDAISGIQDFSKPADQSEKLKIAEAIEQAKRLFGEQIELKRGHLVAKGALGITADVAVNSLFFRFDTNTVSQGITTLLEFGKSSLCFSQQAPCLQPIELDSIELNGEMTTNGVFRVERLNVIGGYGAWLSSGQLKFGPNFSIESYSLKIEGNAEAAPWLSLADLQGRGHFRVNAFVNPEGSLSQRNSVQALIPRIHGQISWSNFYLSGFDVYSGSMEFFYSDFKISYKNALIKTPGGAEIEAFGEYRLKDSMPFLNTAKIRHFSFVELMAGLDVPQDVMNFRMDTEQLLVSGSLDAGKKKGFSLLFSGLVETTQLEVPSFEPNQVKLPKCIVDLRIDSDDNHMSFEGSSMFCGERDQIEIARVSLSKGLIDYKTSANDFRFHAQNLPASVIAYFINEPVEGDANLLGSIQSSKSSSVVFKSDVQINNASVFGLHFSRISGELVLDGKGLTAKGVEAWMDGDKDNAGLKLDSFSYGFSNKLVAADAQFEGGLADVLSALGERGRSLSQRTEGDLTVSRFRMKGDIRELSKANFDLTFEVRHLESAEISAASVQAVFYCQQGLCSGSRVFFRDLVFGEGKQLLSRNRNYALELASSRAIVEIENISERALTVRVDLQSVPVTFKRNGEEYVSGFVDFRGSLEGGLKDWECSASGRIDRLTVGNTPLGSVSLSASSHGGGPLNVIMSGLYDQLQARMAVDHTLRKSTSLFVNLRGFELFKYLISVHPGGVKYNGEASASMVMEGPGIFDFFSNPQTALSAVEGQGEISRFNIQLGRSHFGLSGPVALALSEDSLRYSLMELKGTIGVLKTRGEYDIASKKYSGKIEGKIDAGILSQFNEGISSASGDVIVNSEVELSNDGASLRGAARVENVSLAGRYMVPPVTALNGRLIFQNSRIEIPALTGTKGNGQIDLVGTIDFASEAPGQPYEPSLALRANLRSAQFRWPQEFFETLETTIDGQLEISGRSKPYYLNGEVRVSKGRAYRDSNCQEMLRSGSTRTESPAVQAAHPILELNLGIEADNSFSLQTTCIRGRVSTSLRLAGTNADPVLSGQLRLDNGILNLLKTRFEVTRADAFFDNIVKVEPRLEAQMVAKIDKYSVFVGADGPLSKPRLNIWSDPSTGPDGMPLTRSSLVRMISTGRGPSETTQTAVTQALANQVVGLFDDPLSQAVSKITRGFVDRFELQPILDGGQSSWRARASRDLGEKFNLGLDYEPNKQSLTGTIFINESVNVLGGFDRRSSQSGSYSELSGGFRFQFGGK